LVLEGEQCLKTTKTGIRQHAGEGAIVEEGETMRMVEVGNPLAFAIPRLLQGVSPRGVSSNVRTITCSICSSLICRGAPSRGSSYNPSKRARTNRPRH